jgi:mono/diheme cytochrome c family protein
MKHQYLPASAFLCMMFYAGCSHAPGRPGSEVIPPRQVLDFRFLYAENCSGCHGRPGEAGAAISLGNPVYLAMADDAAIRRTVANGVPGTPMPAFSEKAGGILTDKQVDAIVSGIRSWARPESIGGNVPPYAAETPGDPHRGAEVYSTYCSSCHGPQGRGGYKAGSIVNPSYLALVSNQNLRTLVIVGLPEVGAPDWRNNVPGKPMSPSEISDVVAWLASQRGQYPGQPFPSPAEGPTARLTP